MTIEVGDYISGRRKDVCPQVECDGVVIASSPQGYTLATLDQEGQVAIAICWRRYSRIIAARPVDTPDRQREGDDLSVLDAATRDYVELARASLDVIGHFNWDFATAYKALASHGANYLQVRSDLLKQRRPKKRLLKVKKIDAMSLLLPGSYGSGKRS